MTKTELERRKKSLQANLKKLQDLQIRHTRVCEFNKHIIFVGVSDKLVSDYSIRTMEIEIRELSLEVFEDMKKLGLVDEKYMGQGA